MSSFNLSAMFETIHGAVTDAVHSVESTVWDNMRERYFDKNEEDGSYDPKTIRVNLPNVVEGKIEYQFYDVPVLALVKQNAIALQEMTIEFDVELQDKVETEILASLPSSFKGKGDDGEDNSNTRAKLSMKFKGTDPQEGLMLLNDKLIK